MSAFFSLRPVGTNFSARCNRLESAWVVRKGLIASRRSTFSDSEPFIDPFRRVCNNPAIGDAEQQTAPPPLPAANSEENILKIVSCPRRRALFYSRSGYCFRRENNATLHLRKSARKRDSVQSSQQYITQHCSNVQRVGGYFRCLHSDFSANEIIFSSEIVSLLTLFVQRSLSRLHSLVRRFRFPTFSLSNFSSSISFIGPRPPPPPRLSFHFPFFIRNFVLPLFRFVTISRMSLLNTV